MSKADNHDMELTPKHAYMLVQAEQGESGTAMWPPGYEKALREHAQRARELDEAGYLDRREIDEADDGTISRVLIQISDEGRAALAEHQAQTRDTVSRDTRRPS